MATSLDSTGKESPLKSGRLTSGAERMAQQVMKAYVAVIRKKVKAIPNPGVVAITADDFPEFMEFLKKKVGNLQTVGIKLMDDQNFGVHHHARAKVLTRAEPAAWKALEKSIKAWYDKLESEGGSGVAGRLDPQRGSGPAPKLIDK